MTPPLRVLDDKFIRTPSSTAANAISEATCHNEGGGEGGEGEGLLLFLLLLLLMLLLMLLMLLLLLMLGFVSKVYAALIFLNSSSSPPLSGCNFNAMA